MKMKIALILLIIISIASLFYAYQQREFAFEQRGLAAEYAQEASDQRKMANEITNETVKEAYEELELAKKEIGNLRAELRKCK